MAFARPLSAVAAAVVALWAASGTATARPSGCAPSGYAYAGLELPRARHGIGASLESLAAPLVERGHVAGWVGVGGPGQGPNGSDEWLQVGLNTIERGGGRNRLYYEVARPSGAVRYFEIAPSVPAGRALRVAVLETAARRGVWRVWVNGRPVSPPIRLRGSHLALTPMAMTENWDGGARVCNRFAYRFRGVVVANAPGGGWHTLSGAEVRRDRGFRLARRAGAAFLASTVARPTALRTTAGRRP